MNKNKLREKESLINLLNNLYNYLDICENSLIKRYIKDLITSLNNHLKEIQESKKWII